MTIVLEFPKDKAELVHKAARELEIAIGYKVIALEIIVNESGLLYIDGKDLRNI